MYVIMKSIILKIREGIFIIGMFIKIKIYLAIKQIPIGIIIHEKNLILNLVTFFNCLILINPFKISLIYITAIYPFIE